MPRHRPVYVHAPTGKDRRRQAERRVAADPAYTGPERRQGERRQPLESAKPLPRSLIWLVALVVALLADNHFFAGFYRHWVIDEVSDAATATRRWSDGLWGWTAPKTDGAGLRP